MEDLTRRALLAGACSLLALGATAVPAAAESAIRRLPDGRLEVRVRAVRELNAIGGAVSVGTVRGVPVGVARTGATSYRAFSLSCPHQKVTVERDGQGWFCSAHGSQFEPDGDLVLGPATKGLRRVPTAMKRGRLVVG